MSEEENTKTDQSNTRSLRTAEISLRKAFRSFLSDFDPEKSERVKRKLNQRLCRTKKKGLSYDKDGRYIKTGEDLCDCLDHGCSGCQFPCPKCKSKKCGHVCRSKRKWEYKTIANEGTDIVVENSHFKE